MLSLKAPVTDYFGFVIFPFKCKNILEFFSSPFVKEQSLRMYINVSMMKGCEHKLALIYKQNLNALVFFLLSKVTVSFRLLMGTIVLNRQLLCLC